MHPSLFRVNWYFVYTVAPVLLLVATFILGSATNLSLPTIFGIGLGITLLLSLGCEEEEEAVLHDVIAIEVLSEYGEDDHNIITCRRCKRVLAVDDEVGDPMDRGLCEPIADDTKVRKLIW